jgi:Rieske Fe-S protein
VDERLRDESCAMREVTRRGVLVGGGAVLGGLTLGGCGDERYQRSDQGGPEQGARTPAPGQGGQGIVDYVENLPVGGGKVYPGRQLVLTRPTATDVKGFSAVCTHQSCLVNRVANGTIDCPCHASKFAITDGSVRQGPATKPLPPREVTVDEAGDIRLLE